MVAHNCQGTAKPKTSRQKQNTSRQNQKPHGKTKYFIAKTKYLTAKANTHGKTKAILLLLWSIWFCREVSGFAVRYFVFAVRFLVLPWGILFLPCGFWFGRNVFVFAVRFLVLPWQLWATIKNSTFCYYIWYIRQHFGLTSLLEIAETKFGSTVLYLNLPGFRHSPLADILHITFKGTS